MTEKQRWLLRDLDAWREEQCKAIGNYGPLKEPKEPKAVSAARKSARRADQIIRAWDRNKKLPWERQRSAIMQKYQVVKRSILFEKTEAALKALRSLVPKA